MALPRIRPLTGLLVALVVLAEFGSVVLSSGLEPEYDTLLYAVFSCTMAGTGALILSRQPRHPVGWLLLAAGVENALAGDLAQGWGFRAAAEGWPAGQVAETIDTASWLPQSVLFVLIILLFPSGHLPSRRSLLLVVVGIAGAVLGTVGWVLSPSAGAMYAAGTNPHAVSGLPTQAMYGLGVALAVGAMLGALVTMTVRVGRSTGSERQQLKWIVLSTGVLVVVLALAPPLWEVAPIWHVLTAVVAALWPISIGIAILRYRLYDVDLVISRTVTYIVLTAVLGLVYVGASVVLGVAVGRDSVWVTATATLLAATTFGLLRRRVQDRVDRRFRPARHEALRIIGSFLEELRNDRAEPEEVVDALRLALTDPGLELRFVLQPGEPVVDAHGRWVRGPDDGRERSAVQRGGIVLAEIVWTPASDEDRALLPAVVSAAALAIEMARLRVELRRRLDEVYESRARLAAVADEERRRIERDLHDGAQQRLVSIGLALRHAQHQLNSDPDTAKQTLDGAVVEITAAIEELRELAHGLHPTLLQAGLGPALRELASRAPVPVVVSSTPDRYPPEIEADAYFVACEGLTNAVKHAHADHVELQVARHDGVLVVSVADDGVGGAALDRGSGLTGLSDRVGARGGRLHVESPRGSGTTIWVELPCVS